MYNQVISAINSIWTFCYSSILSLLSLQAEGDPEFKFGDMFTGDAATTRQSAEKKLSLQMGPKTESKYGQARQQKPFVSCLVQLLETDAYLHSSCCRTLIDKRPLQEVYGQPAFQSWQTSEFG